MPEFVAGMGGLKEGESPSDYTLYEMASLYFERYKVKPLVAINVFDPAVPCQAVLGIWASGISWDLGGTGGTGS